MKRLILVMAVLVGAFLGLTVALHLSNLGSPAGMEMMLR